ncbi:MAG: GDP-mannose mannosyl hydrolase [Deltaproteobacteria bacterium RIFCSPLOWO2_02_FULL_53_8]|nr:MAG: GDP-mannose mannosyl hydrolase [Deltaproteobacteria bacterium RIFCSPLOWO2_02_FULL_53_8]
MSVAFLDDVTFRTVVDATPLVSIDLIVRRGDGKILLGQRRNRPAEGFWFVPGGRIRKGETLDAAFRRLSLSELGVVVARSDCRLLGVYEHIYEDSVFGPAPEAPSTHYVVLGYEVRWAGFSELELPLEQHSGYRWFDPDAMLQAGHVHANTKAYVLDL